MNCLLKDWGSCCLEGIPHSSYTTHQHHAEPRPSPYIGFKSKILTPKPPSFPLCLFQAHHKPVTTPTLSLPRNHIYPSSCFHTLAFIVCDENKVMAVFCLFNRVFWTRVFHLCAPHEKRCFGKKRSEKRRLTSCQTRRCPLFGGVWNISRTYEAIRNSQGV